MKRKPLFITLTLSVAAVIVVLIILFLKEPTKPKADNKTGEEPEATEEPEAEPKTTLSNGTE